MAAIPFVITNAGLSLISGGGTVNLTTLQVGTGTYTVPSPTSATALVSPISTTLTLVGSSTPGTGILALAFEDLTSNAYNATEMGVFTSTGVLFALYSQSTAIFTKAAASASLISIDLVLTNSQATSVTVPSTPGFNYPSATPTTAGVAQIATTALVTAGVDNTTIITPALLSARLGAISYPYVPLSSVVGALQHFPFTSAPSGWLKANGAAISRTVYSALFTAIGTSFGVGDGSTTFNVPDLRGEFLRGYDDGRGVDTGRTFASIQQDAIQDHVHRYRLFQNQGAGGSGFYALQTSANTSYYTDGVYDVTASHPYVGTTETRPRNVAHLACIKY